MREVPSDAIQRNEPLLGEQRDLFDILWDAIEAMDTMGICFIPLDKLEMARNPALVERALRGKDGVTQDKIPEVLDTICPKTSTKSSPSFFRILSILVLCQRTGYIQKFIDLGVNDSFLPFPELRRRVRTTHSDNTERQSVEEVNNRKLKEIFRDKSHWGRNELETFETHQWRAISPFLYRKRNSIPHFVLNSKDVLPFTRTGPGDLAGNKTEVLDENDNILLSGGFGDVDLVEIHPSHHDFSAKWQGRGSSKDSFALKRLRSINENDFKMEVKAFRKYDFNIHQHFIPLLATIEIVREGAIDNRGWKYALLFPKAQGNLTNLWERNFNNNSLSSALPWMAKQCFGLAGAVSRLHREQDTYKEEDHPIYGRHGDIKAANILWFLDPEVEGPYPWHLVIADFGLTEFHRNVSISLQTANRVKKTVSYQAPEFDVRGARISRRSDIWALGCTFLEFVTCYIEGFQAVSEEFPSCRGERDSRIMNFYEDKFYRIINDGQEAIIKPGVKDWISRLRDHPRCTPFLESFIDFIEEHMFQIVPKSRPTADEVVKKLEEFVKHGLRDRSFMEGNQRTDS
ncbi:kinase-like protein [Durotheca rogersii]|uniref:kinase-like protein n=1 Tax=Durotheca rogersii TaxID=419775 RepID=UPI00221E79DB|nr:kinase-like protein [Durotheca rogersii]KAI5853638.1 kinase-like protein [Durotheca rogersii]